MFHSVPHPGDNINFLASLSTESATQRHRQKPLRRCATTPRTYNDRVPGQDALARLGVRLAVPAHRGMELNPGGRGRRPGAVPPSPPGPDPGRDPPNHRNPETRIQGEGSVVIALRSGGEGGGGGPWVTEGHPSKLGTVVDEVWQTAMAALSVRRIDEQWGGRMRGPLQPSLPGPPDRTFGRGSSSEIWTAGLDPRLPIGRWLRRCERNGHPPRGGGDPLASTAIQRPSRAGAMPTLRLSCTVRVGGRGVGLGPLINVIEIFFFFLETNN